VTTPGEATPAPGTSASATVTLGDPRPAPPLLDLVDSDGSPFDLADHRGAPTLIFFGYTHCPDVCPATIGELIGVLEALPSVQAVFITVDPERDTVELLGNWESWLPDGFHAVTGSPIAIRRAADAWGARYAKGETDASGRYAMAHTADIYLVDADGQHLLTYPFGTLAATMIADVSQLMDG
jgi:protein SCO1/2